MSTKIEVIVDQRMLKDGKKNEDFEGLEGEVSNVLQRFISLRIGISMENISNTFIFSVPFMLGKGLRTGMPVRITMGGENILVGYINGINRKLRSDNAMVEVSGRSKTGDLVDCQVLYPQTANIHFKTVVKSICDRLKIDIDYKAKNNPLLPSVTIPHESPFEEFAKIAARNGLVLLSDGDGRLVVMDSRPYNNTFIIEQGNMGLAILSVQHAQTTEEFSTYRALQTGSFLFPTNAYGHTFQNPNTNPLAINTPMRYRPCAFTTSSKGSKEELKRIAEFQYYRANPNTLVMQVQGWGYVDEEGTMCPWQVNMVHPVVIKELDIKGDFLIETVEFNLSNDGKTTTLTLCSPMKYNQEPIGKK